jgi:hypothetical protein
VNDAGRRRTVVQVLLQFDEVSGASLKLRSVKAKPLKANIVEKILW